MTNRRKASQTARLTRVNGIVVDLEDTNFDRHGCCFAFDHDDGKIVGVYGPYADAFTLGLSYRISGKALRKGHFVEIHPYHGSYDELMVAFGPEMDREYERLAKAKRKRLVEKPPVDRDAEEKRLRDQGRRYATEPICQQTRERVLALRKQGNSYRKIAKLVGISLSSVQRILKQQMQGARP